METHRLLLPRSSWSLYPLQNAGVQPLAQHRPDLYPSETQRRDTSILYLTHRPCSHALPLLAECGGWGVDTQTGQSENATTVRFRSKSEWALAQGYIHSSG